jgi:UDP-N-acetylglucosamine:LPS N-acetylglucosamine transferase
VAPRDARLTHGEATRQALILSGRFGKGHDTVAEACAVALAPLGFESRIVDSIELLGDRGGNLGERVFRAVLGRPAIYDAFHFGQLRPGGGVARRLDELSLRVMWPRFLDVCAQAPPALIVSVFATGAAAAARYKQAHPDVATVVFISDAYAHAMWVHAGTDLFAVPSAASEAAVRRYLPRANVRLVTQPTRPAFYAAPSRDEARRQLGVPHDARCVLLMSGAWGVGPMADCAAALARRGVWVLAVAGSNAQLEQLLRDAAGRDRRVVPFGYTDRIPELMAAADLVVSASGDTCREARVMGRPLLLLDVLPGHGRENVIHELELGNARIATPMPGPLVEAVEAYLDDADALVVAPVASPEKWEDEFRDALASIGVA